MSYTRPWTPLEDEFLRYQAGSGMPLAVIAAVLGRTEDATRRRHQRLRRGAPGHYPPRRCAVCGHTLSRWNPYAECWSCPAPAPAYSSTPLNRYQKERS